MSALPLPAHGDEAGSELSISLLTFGPGEIYWERFGHNAIRIRNTADGSDIAYNYGMFDFSEENFFLNFARGRMSYLLQADYTEGDLPLYAQEGRWVIEQQLNFAPAQRAQLRQFLEWNRRPENARYRYDYFVANCSTRVRDALDRALGGVVHTQLASPSKGFTYRMHADRLMQPDPLTLLGMDAGLGPYADKRLSYWDESFVPMELMEHLRLVKVRDAEGHEQPLVTQERQLIAARLAEPPAFPSDLRWPMGAAGFAIAGALLWLVRLRQRAWPRAAFSALAIVLSLTCSIGGLVLVALWGLTEHLSAWRNENLLLLNPLCWLLLPTWWRARRIEWHVTRFGRVLAGAIAALALCALALKVLPWFLQHNGPWIALLLPPHIALWLAVRRAST
jgi:hypothetical protein